MQTMTRPPHHWTPEQLALLRLWVPIEGCEKFGVRSGIGHTTVRKQVRKEGITIGRARVFYTLEMTATIKDMLAKGSTVREIAQAIGVDLSSITFHLQAKRRRVRPVVLVAKDAPRPEYSKPSRREFERSCKGCQYPFMSQGAHNRFCERCRSSMSSDDSYNLTNGVSVLD